jgi:hypothetical protein
LEANIELSETTENLFYGSTSLNGQKIFIIEPCSAQSSNSNYPFAKSPGEGWGGRGRGVGGGGVRNVFGRKFLRDFSLLDQSVALQC